jgi:hypothetical protein
MVVMIPVIAVVMLMVMSRVRVSLVSMTVCAATFLLGSRGRLIRRRMLMMVVVHTRLTELARNSYTFSWREARFV